MISLNWFGLRKENFEYSGCMKEYSSLCIVSIIIIQICKNGIVFNTAISIFQETALNPIRMCYDIPLLYINTSLEIRVNESSCTHTHTSLHFLHPSTQRMQGRDTFHLVLSISRRAALPHPPYSYLTKVLSSVFRASSVCRQKSLTVEQKGNIDRIRFA